MDDNVLEVAFVATTTYTGSLSPLTNQSLDYDELLRLVDGNTSSGVTVSTGQYIV